MYYAYVCASQVDHVFLVGEAWAGTERIYYATPLNDPSRGFGCLEPCLYVREQV